MSTDDPLWQQVLDDLDERLSTGEIGPGFPTDRELVEHYEVSRHTVREAVGHLKARGVIQRERGRGSFVARAEFAQPLGTLYSLFREVEAQGATQTSVVVSRGWQQDQRAADRFGLDPSTFVFHLERVRHADGVPLALDSVWLPPDLGRLVEDADFSRTSLYDELERNGGLRPTAGDESITPVVPDDDLRRTLELDEGEGVLRLERTSRHDDRIMECRVTLLRGARLALVSRWPDGGAVRPVLDS